MAGAGRRADLVPVRYQTVEGGGDGIGRRPGIGPKGTTGYQTTAREGTKSFRRVYQTVPCVQVPFGTMRTELSTLRGAGGFCISLLVNFLYSANLVR